MYCAYTLRIWLTFGENRYRNELDAALVSLLVFLHLVITRGWRVFAAVSRDDAAQAYERTGG